MSPEYRWIVRANLPDGRSAKAVQQAIGLLQGVGSVQRQPLISTGLEAPQTAEYGQTRAIIDSFIMTGKLGTAGRELGDDVLLDDLIPKPGNKKLQDHSAWAAAIEELLPNERRELSRILNGLINRGYRRNNGDYRYEVNGYRTLGEVRRAEDLRHEKGGKWTKALSDRRILFIRNVFG